MTTRTSPLAPPILPALPRVAGVDLAIGNAGIWYRDRPDLMLARFTEGTAAAGMFTRSTTAGPPVEWCRGCLGGGIIRGLVVNAGNANAFTGDPGRAVVRKTAEAAAGLIGCSPAQVFISSTGVIGEPPPGDRLAAALPSLFAQLAADAWGAAARAIMTTDTFPKMATRNAGIDGKPVVINGIAKGSGMLMPNMATMLVYIASDAAVSPSALQALLRRAVDDSFHCITVDGDTSTSDTILAAATGAAGNRAITAADDPRASGFAEALHSLCLDLSHQVVKDGEGATKFVTVRVSGAISDESARTIAFAIANSPLVKTAIAGQDANWGRIIMAAGKSFEPIDQQRTSVAIGGIPIANGGARISGFDEGPVAAHMRGASIDIELSVGAGSGRAVVWTCDLTHGYIDINADYRS